MATLFPTDIDVFQDHVDNANEKISASHINNMQHAIVAIENEVKNKMVQSSGDNVFTGKTTVNNFFGNMYAEFDAGDLTLGQGSLVNDTLCFRGKTVKFTQTSSPVSTLLGQVAYSRLRYGKYSVGFRMKSSNNSSTLGIADLRVSTSNGTVANLEVKGTDFKNTTGYQMFYLQFENIGNSIGNTFTLSVYSKGLASYTLSIDSIIVAPTHGATSV